MIIDTNRPRHRRHNSNWLPGQIIRTLRRHRNSGIALTTGQIATLVGIQCWKPVERILRELARAGLAEHDGGDRWRAC